ncbi:unnamed protein product [Periconia digitata]|uniref:Uncharacterized protein n=1 Tax=Periconia digitata TaxID=1303443 RepID=A0A9W4XQI7_9PLEO|nr:unnamed protein product [Periconia digitata]
MSPDLFDRHDLDRTSSSILNRVGFSSYWLVSSSTSMSALQVLLHIVVISYSNCAHNMEEVTNMSFIHAIILPIHFSFTITFFPTKTPTTKHRFPTKLIFLALTLISSVFQILAYTSLTILSTTKPAQPSSATYRSLFLFSINISPTLLTAALSVYLPYVCAATVQPARHTTSNANEEVGKRNTRPRNNATTHGYSRVLERALQITYSLVMILQLIGLCLIATITSSTDSPPTAIQNSGTALLRASLALHALCIIAMISVVGGTFRSAFLPNRPSSSQLEHDNSGEERKMKTNRRSALVFLLVLLLTTSLPLLIRTIYRSIDPYSGIAFTGDDEMRYFYGLDASMILLVHLGVTMSMPVVRAFVSKAVREENGNKAVGYGDSDEEE